MRHMTLGFLFRMLAHGRKNGGMQRANLRMLCASLFFFSALVTQVCSASGKFPSVSLGAWCDWGESSVNWAAVWHSSKLV